MSTPRQQARDALTVAVRDRDAAREVYDAADSRLRDAIRAAESVGVSLVEIARVTGLHRNTVRSIVGEPGR